MLPFVNRLRKTKEFDLVFKEGKSFYSDYFGLKIKENTLGVNRFGLIVSAKVSKKAVIRNRLKREIRNIIKNEKGALKVGFDCVLIFFSLILDKSYQDKEKLLKTAFKKVNLYK